MFEGLFDCPLNSNRFRRSGGIIYNLAGSAQNDFPEDAFAGFERVILDLFCVCTESCNCAPTCTLCLRQVDRAALGFKSIFFV